MQTQRTPRTPSASVDAPPDAPGRVSSIAGQNLAFEYGQQLGRAAKLRGERREIEFGDRRDIMIQALAAGYSAGREWRV